MCRMETSTIWFYRTILTCTWYKQHYFHHFFHDLWQRDIYNLLRNSFLDALLRQKLNHLHCLLHAILPLSMQLACS